MLEKFLRNCFIVVHKNSNNKNNNVGTIIFFNNVKQHDNRQQEIKLT